MLNIFKAKQQVSGAGVTPKIYHCGTLTYTKAGIFAIFAWLLWGDFCYTLMEIVVPSVLPLKLKALGTPNWLMAMILSTIPSFFNMTICPYVSFKSDRYRSRWGRRIPFIVATLPFLCISLVALGCSEDISLFLQKHMPLLSGFAPVTITIALIAVFMAFFQFFNMFVSSVFWYLFNDVVPPQFLSRFVGLFRIVGAGASSLYSYFIYQYAGTHMREILLGAAALYFIGFGIVCLVIKEGGYPPVEGDADRDNKGWRGIRTFFKECFTHKFYWLFFAFTSFSTVVGVINMFNVFFYLEMGLTLDDVGKFIAVTGIASLVAVYFAAIFVDRWHPLRVYVYLRIFIVLTYFSSWVWLFITLPGKIFFWLCMAGGLIAAFQNALAGVAELPLYMRLLPKSRYGQFCSAQALLRSFCTMIAAVVAGMFIDYVKWLYGGSDFAFRFIFVWNTVFSIVTAALAVWFYFHWHRLGGDENFHPPAPWSPSGKEEMELVASIGPQRRWLNISFNLFNAIMALSVLGIPFLMWWMHLKNAMTAFFWHGILLLPLSLAAWLLWIFVQRGIRRDIERADRNETLRNGIPHHGILIVVALKFLLAIGLWIVQVVIMVNMNMEFGATVFTVANIVTDFLLIGSVYLICRIERGYSVKLYEKLA